jgi:hypothetical protein
MNKSELLQKAKEKKGGRERERGERRREVQSVCVIEERECVQGKSVPSGYVR